MKALIFVKILLITLILLLSACGSGSSTPGVGLAADLRQKATAEATAHYEAGKALQERGYYQEAVAEYYKAIQLKPNFVEAYSSRGFAYHNMGRHRLALRDFDEAIALDPEYASAYAGRSLAYTILGSYTEAERDLELAMSFGVDPAILQKDQLERLRRAR